jgi:dihydrodipicolinate synthase/N-acetylneuraminate lyase
LSATEKKKIEGIYTPLLVPMDDAGHINEAEMRRHINWLIKGGIHGLYPNGSSGEFTRYTAQERRRITQMVVEEAAGRVPIIAGAAEANARETIAACEAYSQMGIRAVAIVAPFYYKLTPESVYAYFAEIARNSPIDLTLYNIPMFASPIDVPTIRRLADEFPRVIGIKDSTGDVSQMMRMIAAIRPQRPDFTFLTGWEAVLVPMLLVGCDGGTHASSNVVPEVTRRIYDLVRMGDLATAMQWQYRLLELFDAMLYPFEFPYGFKAATELRGFHFGAGRLDLTAAQRAENESLTKILQCILSDFELVKRPDSGCALPARSADVAALGTPELQQIITQVVTELKNRGMV